MYDLTDSQLRAVRYYIGDVQGADPFLSEPNAYLVLNSLLYSGTQTEKARAGEGKKLNPFILSDTQRLIDLYMNLFSAFKKSEKDYNTFRVERFSDYETIRENNSTVSFTSTSVLGFLGRYQDRKGIALMKFEIPAGTPCIVMEDVLKSYAKADEAEILLPPFMKLEIKETALSPEELKILDSKSHPPVVSCTAKTCGIIRNPVIVPDFPENGAEAGQRFYNALNNGTVPNPEDEEIYCLWKNALRIFLMNNIKNRS